MKSSDRLYQVGKTVNGIPVEHTQLELIADQITSSMELHQSSNLIDLGCGNAVLTERLAACVAFVRAVERSEDLVQVAKSKMSADNIELINADIFEFMRSTVHDANVCLYEVVQHFQTNQLRRLFHLAYNAKVPKVFLGGIPDNRRLFNFFDSQCRKRDYFRYLEGIEPEYSRVSCMGTWWWPEHIQQIGNDIGYQVQILAQPPSLYTSHYRFDAIAKRTG
jgi:hypothetical protein